MSFGIEGALPHPPAGCVTSEEAARHCGVSVEEITQYGREGLLISLPSRNGIPYYTEYDYSWIHTLKRLREEAHLSFDGIRQLLLSRCGCWQFRRCEFHNTKACPIMTDPSRPCWDNRARWSVLMFHPCYECVVYRSLPACASLRSVLHGADPQSPPPDLDIQLSQKTNAARASHPSRIVIADASDCRLPPASAEAPQRKIIAHRRSRERLAATSH